MIYTRDLMPCRDCGSRDRLWLGRPRTPILCVGCALGPVRTSVKCADATVTRTSSGIEIASAHVTIAVASIVYVPACVVEYAVNTTIDPDDIITE